MPYPPRPSIIQTQQSITDHAHSVSDVPFKLSPELASDDTNEISGYQINEIRSFITSSAQNVSRLNYDFRLERTLVVD